MADEPPLDEVQWRSPALAAQMGGIHTNTVLPYFSESPFFDRTSNNAVVTNQALYNPAMLYLVQTRAAFERHLASMTGLEFVVAHDPSRGDTVHDHGGAWVVRKQTRRKRPGVLADEITPLAAYFVVGESVYMAPSVASVVQCRLLATINSLNKFVSTASSLPLFTPALGHAYTTPRPKPVVSGTAEGVAPTQASDADSPPIDAHSVSSVPRPRVPSDESPTGAVARETSLLAQSLRLLERYGDEYMDETPLLGEPGSFIMQRAKDGAKVPVRASKSQQGSDESAEKGEQLDGPESAGVGAARAATSPSPPPPPPPIKTDLASEVHRRVKGAEKSPLTPGGGKKRKKSKIQTPKTPK